MLAEILSHIREMERRRLYLVQGYPSLFLYLVKEFGYSESEAYRRIEASRLMLIVPEVKEELIAGNLSLSTIAEVRTAVRREERRTGTRIPPARQKELIESVRHCTHREAEGRLAEELQTPPRVEKVVQTRDGGIVLELPLNSDQRAKLERARDILAHQGPPEGYREVIVRMADFFLHKRDLAQGFNGAAEASRYPGRKLPIALRRAVFRRDRGRCQFRKPDGGICGSTYQVEIDHIVPVSRGGSSELENLQCLCRAHNQWKGAKPESR